MDITLTAEQTAILDYASEWPDKRSALRANPLQNLMVEALAGTAKTTTSALFAEALPSYCNILALAFNKLIATELAAKMPPEVMCKTFSALGYGVWRTVVAAENGKKCGLKKWKNHDIWKGFEIGHMKDQFPDFARMLSLAKAYGMAPAHTDHQFLELMPDTDDNWYWIAEKHDLTLGKKGGLNPERGIKALRAALMRSVNMSYQGEIDFDDMLYMPALFGGPFPYCDVVIVDEFQDVNEIQFTLINRLLGQHGNLIAVGDRYQSIYAFRGADSEAIPRGIAEFKCKQLPLTATFRCSQAVTAEAQELVPMIHAFPFNSEGIVKHLDQWSASNIEVGDAILCRNNAPLMGICLHLIKKGVPAQILGNDIGKALIKMLKDLDTNNLMLVPERLNNILRAKGDEYKAKNMMGLLHRLEDRIDALNYVCSGFHDAWEHRDGTVHDVMLFLETMFSDGSPQVTLSSVHKAKGREWNTVYILDPWLIPSKYATSEKAIQQENNIEYVAVTRARHNLFYINSTQLEENNNNGIG